MGSRLEQLASSHTERTALRSAAPSATFERLLCMGGGGYWAAAGGREGSRVAPARDRRRPLLRSKVWVLGRPPTISGKAPR